MTFFLGCSAVPEFDYSLTSGAMSLGKECAEKECSRKRYRCIAFYAYDIVSFIDGALNFEVNYCLYGLYFFNF